MTTSAEVINEMKNWHVLWKCRSEVIGYIAIGNEHQSLIYFKC